MSRIFSLSSDFLLGTKKHDSSECLWPKQSASLPNIHTIFIHWQLNRPPAFNSNCSTFKWLSATRISFDFLRKQGWFQTHFMCVKKISISNRGKICPCKLNVITVSTEYSPWQMLQSFRKVTTNNIHSLDTGNNGSCHMLILEKTFLKFQLECKGYCYLSSTEAAK